MIYIAGRGEREALHPPPRHHLRPPGGETKPGRGELHPPHLQPRHLVPGTRTQLQVRQCGDRQAAEGPTGRPRREAGQPEEVPRDRVPAAGERSAAQKHLTRRQLQAGL